jgi:putative hydrolase of the HAD superfamily
MPVEAVVVDIGGVLEHTPPTGWVRRWEAELGVAPGEVGRRIEDLGEAGRTGRITEAQWRTTVRDRLGLSAEQLARFADDMWEEYLGSPNTELIAWVRGLRPRVRTGILSNSFPGAREREQERYGLADLTDVLVYSHEVGAAKPDPAVYRLVCARLGVPPERAVFVDDREAAVDGARAVGMTGVLFGSTAQVVADVEALLAGG